MPGLRRGVSLLLAAALGACSEGAPASACSQLPREGIVAVERNGRSHCLGVVVEDGWVLTAQHCVQDAALSELGVQDGGPAHEVESVALRVAPTDAVAGLHGQDLAVLRVPTLQPSPVAVGSPLGGDACVARARDRAVVDAPIRVIESTAIYAAPETTPGDSGGPLVDLEGAVVGIASWRAEGASVFTRIDAHEAWLWDVIDGAE